MQLRDLKPGQSGIITAVGGQGALRQHFLDMGVIPGATVTVTKLAPMGDPMELRIRGYELTLRLGDAEKIDITPADAADEKKPHPRPNPTAHPGLGEEGKFHPKGTGTPHARGHGADLRPGGQPELRQDHVVQPAHRRQPARGQLPRRHRGSEGRRHPGPC